MAVRTRMKRILIIDESEVVRETLALILGREFYITKRPLGSAGLPGPDTAEDVDLLILGVSPQYGLASAGLAQLAAQLPFAMLFLVDAKPAARVFDDGDGIECLVKPFNPYELKDRVAQLLSRGKRVIEGKAAAVRVPGEELSYCLDYPFLSRSAATLAVRFAASQLPLLLHGERGCGQLQLAAAIGSLHKGGAASINVTEISADYLSGKLRQIRFMASSKDLPLLLTVEQLDRCDTAGQSRLAEFLASARRHGGELRLISTANDDLLARVYGGEFSESLYYQLASLTLRLPPLRERLADLPALVQSFAGRLAQRLGRKAPEFTPAALERLANYLWFGNLRELETVLARTMVLRPKAQIDASDLLFDFGGESENFDGSDLVEFVPLPGALNAGPAATAAGYANGAHNGESKAMDLNLVIQELAHELKNPMVTIKTFAQLLGDRYQDENFRTRFQEVVGSDIERMDDLVEVMMEFAEFGQPRHNVLALEEVVGATVGKLAGECAKRQTGFDWKKNGRGVPIRSDEKQLSYIIKNVLSAIVAESKMGADIEIDVSAPAALTITAAREGARVASIGHYLSGTAGQPQPNILPLRMLLAKHLLERNGGRLMVDQSDADKDIIRMEFPTVEYGQEN